MTKQDNINSCCLWRLGDFFEEILSETLIPMRCYNGVTLCIDGDYCAVNLAVPVFALSVDVAFWR